MSELLKSPDVLSDLLCLIEDLVNALSERTDEDSEGANPIEAAILGRAAEALALSYTGQVRAAKE